MISVAMTTFNGQNYLKEQLDSILNQTMPVDEIIICDDCSTDNTIDLISTYSDSRIHLIKNKYNLGYVKNFHQAIKNCSGDYILLADQDDIWEKNKVECLIETINQTGASLVCSNFSLIDSNSQKISMNNFKISKFVRNHKKQISTIPFYRLVMENIAQGCTYCFTKEIKDIYVKTENYDVIHDWQISLIASYTGKAIFLNKPLIQYRIHANNSVGFSDKTIQKRKKRTLKIPKLKPSLICFFNDLDKHIRIKNIDKTFLNIIYYFRIWYIFNKFIY